MQQIPADLVLDTLAIFIREALYEQLPPEQRMSARHRPYPPQLPAAVVQALTRQEKQQPCLFTVRQDASCRQQCTPMSTRPSKTETVHQAQCKRPYPAGMDFAGAGIWVGGLSRHATIGEVNTWRPEWCASTVVHSWLQSKVVYHDPNGAPVAFPSNTFIGLCSSCASVSHGVTSHDQVFHLGPGC